MNMLTKNLTVIIALAAVTTLSTLNLNASEPAPSPQAKACCSRTAPVTTADPNLIARNSVIAASPKTLANFPQLAKTQAPKPSTPMIACGCCKP
jgi:hypothetical protein